MDDGELDFFNQEVFSSPNMGDQFPWSCSMDSFDEILKDTHACTHTHTCNPPGPDLSHTHTCFHVHTKILSASPDDKVSADETAESTEKCPKKRPLGNREAVRKYREKKKARDASLEDEVARLKAINQQYVKRLHALSAIEAENATVKAEIARLKCLLVDIRGGIQGELGSFPYQRVGKGGDGAMCSMHSPNISGGYVWNSCDIRCNDQLNCMDLGVQGGGLRGPGFGVCDISNVHCTGNLTAGLELAGCGSANVASAGIPSSTSKCKSANAPVDLTMDDGELDFFNQEVFLRPNMGDQFPRSCSMDSFPDEILKDPHACTHTHTCNPPGPDLSHTHTCFHVHTKVLSGPPDDKVSADETAESTEKCPKKRPLGNREAVRKYREKKKARFSSLKDEFARLTASNQQYVKRVHALSAVEAENATVKAENARLKCLLVYLSGTIQGVLGSFPYQKVGKGGDGAMSSMHSPNISGGYVWNSCDIRCNDQLNCMDLGVQGGGLRGPGFGVCDISNVHCTGNLTAGLELAGCGSANVASAGIPSSTSKRKSANAPAEG